jgi:hypothetical protein
VLDAHVVVGALGHELVLDLDGREARCLAHADGAVHVHGVAVAARAVQDERQRGDRADVDRGLAHLGDVEVGLEGDLLVAGGAAAEVAGGEASRLHHARHQRVEDERRGGGQRAPHGGAQRGGGAHQRNREMTSLP